jgi:crotonobetainyl-CoA:carnitine CoA-transferase CaiB-like acyl-CoA transferase
MSAASQGNPAPSSARPLAGLRVVDMADEKGELCGRLLADLGAEVIRIEPPEGALSRRLPPFAEGADTSLYFIFRNAGKRGAVVDLNEESGRARLHALLDSAEIFIESTHPGTLAALGLSREALLERHPQLIVTSISDFGQDGPYADYQGTEMVSFAMGGMMHRAGRLEKPPVVAPGSLAYDVAGVSAAQASLLAFYKRLQTGRGQLLDVSAMDATANLADWSLPNFSLNAQMGQRAGSGIYTLYACEDGFIRMIILVTKHWRALLEWVGRPEELADPAYDQFIHRLANLPKIVSVLEEFFKDKKKIDVACEAQRRGIPATPLLRPAEVLENEHTIGRGTFCSLPVGDDLEARFPSGFLTVDDARVGPIRGAPALGELGDEGFAPADSAREGMEALLARTPAGSDDPYPFRGLRVIDFGVGAVGVEAARFFAEFGAEVIKIETRSAPDFIRVILSSYMNASFASSSRTKESFGVDLKDARGIELVRRLIMDADICIENNGTGVMERLGLGFEDLCRENPRLVCLSSQSVGSYGPWKDWIGYGPNTHPVSGLQYLWNYPEDEASPAGSTAVYPDHFVGRIGATSITAGLIGRERMGKGSRHDAAQFESSLGLLGDLFAQESLAPGSTLPLGNASKRGAPWGCYPCEGEEEWCVITVRSDEEWRALVEVIGEPDWAGKPAFANAAGRIAEREAIDAELAKWTATLDPRSVMERLQAVGVPCGMVAHPAHHMGDPQMTHRNYAKFVDQPGLGTILLEGPAFIGSDLPEVITRPAPWLGEHTREIASRLLGLSDDEIESLIEAKVLEDPPEEYQPA